MTVAPETKSLPLRRIAREWALCLLYQLEINQSNLNDLITSGYLDQLKEIAPNLGDKELAKVTGFSDLIVHGVMKHKDMIDNILLENAMNWRLDRMAVVDRNVLRIALYELLYVADIPASVSINEAIEIVKTYGADDSSRFVNGILDKISKSYPPLIANKIT